MPTGTRGAIGQKLTEEQRLRYNVNRVKARRLRPPEWFEANNKYMKEYNQKLKLEALQKYGEHCQCCKESWPIFLTIDHIDGKGAAHRAAIGSKDRSAGSKFYLWLKNNGYPPGFQVLCFNCNFAKFFFFGL